MVGKDRYLEAYTSKLQSVIDLIFIEKVQIILGGVQIRVVILGGCIGKSITINFLGEGIKYRFLFKIPMKGIERKNQKQKKKTPVGDFLMNHVLWLTSL